MPTWQTRTIRINGEAVDLHRIEARWGHECHFSSITSLPQGHEQTLLAGEWAEMDRGDLRALIAPALGLPREWCKSDGVIARVRLVADEGK